MQLVNSWFNFYLSPENSRNIRLDASLVGGSLWDVGVYPNSMAITMIDQGAPRSVFASQIVGESGVDVAMRGQLVFGNGAVGQVSSGFRTPFREGALIVGDEGILNLVEPWKPGLKGEPSRMVLTGRSGADEEIVTPAIDPYLCEVQAMEACVLDGAAPVVPLSLRRAFLQSALAQYASAASGEAVTLRV
ncbi:MAG: hypothetical protein HC802_08445 [Caldilineaceae bacterium]|nr:hypothetical protein [Caldilineaceae bacterium]